MTLLVAPQLELVAVVMPARCAWFWRWGGRAYRWVGEVGEA